MEKKLCPPSACSSDWTMNSASAFSVGASWIVTRSGVSSTTETEDEAGPVGASWIVIGPGASPRADAGDGAEDGGAEDETARARAITWDESVTMWRPER